MSGIKTCWTSGAPCSRGCMLSVWLWVSSIFSFFVFPHSRLHHLFSFTLLSCSYVQLMEGIVSKNLISYSIEPSHSTVHFFIKIIEKKTLPWYLTHFTLGWEWWDILQPCQYASLMSAKVGIHYSWSNHSS